MDTYTDFYNFTTINNLIINMVGQSIHVDFDSLGHTPGIAWSYCHMAIWGNTNVKWSLNKEPSV